MNRRDFIKSGFAIAGAAGVSPWGFSEAEAKMTGKIMTATGAIDPRAMGFVLTHEHILVDFIGADQVGPDRYNPDEAFAVILPYLKQAKALGCQTFVECTPSFIGKDPALVKRLSEAVGIHMLTNTGYYGAADDKFVPSHAFSESADALSERWVSEWENGIAGTGVRPGFIKIGVDRTSLSPIDEKLVRAAARTHLRTGLTIMSHTGFAVPAHEEIAVLKEEGVSPSAWIWTHAQNESDNLQHKKAAEAGAWVAFDGVNASEKRLARDVAHLEAMRSYGLLDQVLLSHDAGWFEPGKPGGGTFRPFVDLFQAFLPALRESGFSQAEIDLMTLENPKRAFAIGVRGD
jgi:predicted metal-dependent phosphotriesterase family hydrolase